MMVMVLPYAGTIPMLTLGQPCPKHCQYLHLVDEAWGHREKVPAQAPAPESGRAGSGQILAPGHCSYPEGSGSAAFHHKHSVKS